MNDSYDFCILITTYDRGNMLYDLINQIEKQKNNSKILIVIFDDGSPQNYQFDNQNIKYVKFFPNQGKKKYWKIVNVMFNYVRHINANYFIQLPDDIQLVDNFFGVVVNEYEKIQDPSKICLNILSDSRIFRHNWTNFNPIDMGDHVKTQWNDMCYISTKEFFKDLNYGIDEVPMSRWNNNPNLSSGVGQQISLKLHKNKKSMYHTKRSLVIHGDHDSKMNYNERHNTPIITI
jgi:glycosyltransferase involved in cell wall biosynthesis